MRINLDTYKHLLPRARAWKITIDKQLRQLFQGLSDEPSDIQDYQDDVWLDYRPADTTKLEQWEDQFALLPSDATEQARRDALDAAWKETGGQSPRYLQDTVRAAGFDVFIYESFVRENGSCVFRSPWLYVDDGRSPDYIISDGIMGEPTFQAGEALSLMEYFFNNGPVVFLIQCGEPEAQCGEPNAQAGQFRRLGTLLTEALPAGAEIPAEGSPELWPFIIYWAGAPFMDEPTTAIIDKDRETEFKTLVARLCPAQNWISIQADYL